MTDARKGQGKRTGRVVPPPPIRRPPPLSAPKRATRAEASPAEPERIWPITWAAIIVGSGTVLLLLWALVFRDGSGPQQPAEKDQPPLVAAESAESGDSAPNWETLLAHIPHAEAQSPESEDSAPAPQPVPQPAETTPAAAPAAESKSAPPTGNVKILELADLAELVGPSVVQVNVTGPEGAGTGSGFVLDKQGTIVTNFHVIADATAGRIVFSDRTSAPIIGYLGVWPEKDIALVRVECPPEKLHPLRLATSVPRQGERVAAFGSPLGLQQSVSEGIVSAVRDSKELQALGPIDVNARLVQTTAPISPGNSGGPLVDMKGMVVGINTWTFRFLGGENVNFAVAAVELAPLLVAKNDTPSPLPAGDPAAIRVRRILSRAAEHLNAGEYGRAIAEFTEAIRLDPEDADAYSGRALAYYRKLDFDSAIAEFTEAIRLDPTKADAYYWRGWAYFGKDDYDGAIADLTEAIRLTPEDAGAYVNRGLAYFGKDDYDSAIADLTEAIRLNRENAGTYYFRGSAYQAKGDYDSAIADFTEAIRLEAKYAGAYIGRGKAYQAKGDYDSAIADYTQAIRLDPDGVTYYNRGLVYQAKGELWAAERDFAKAKELGYDP